MNLIETYLIYLSNIKRYSGHTVNAYRNDLRSYERFLAENAKDERVECATQKDVRDWILFLIENKITPRSVNRKITALKTFYRYLLKQDVIRANPALKIDSLKTEKKLPVFVKEEKMEFLFDEIGFGDDYEGQRNKMILELFYITGIRLSELINLNINDIDILNKTIKVTGKRNKQRIIPLPFVFLSKLNDYMELRKQHVSGPYLFCTAKNEKLYPKLVYRMVNKYLALVSTQKKKSPHVLRHTFASHMLNKGADLNAIKEILGHANLSATEVYTHVSFDKLKSIYKHAHPRAIIMED